MNETVFSSVAEVYHHVRPVIPEQVMAAVKALLPRPMETVVDLGCGSGHSTVRWKQLCRQVIGIEPNEEMLAIARQLADGQVTFIKASGSHTGLPRESADGVVCCQSFHWMEPESTLREVGRILKPGGVFAAIDYEWPPVSHQKVMDCYNSLYRTAKELVKQQQGRQQTFVRWDKEKHLQKMKESGVFCCCKEIELEAEEACNAQRLYQMALSQSWIEMALNHSPAVMEPLLEEYRKVIETVYGDREFAVKFCYRMRIGVK